MWPKVDDAEELVCLECLAHYLVTGEDEPASALVCEGCGTELVSAEAADVAA